MTAPTLPPCPLCGKRLSQHTKHMTAKHEGNTCLLMGHNVFNQTWVTLFLLLAAGLRATGAEPHTNFTRWEADNAKR